MDTLFVFSMEKALRLIALILVLRKVLKVQASIIDRIFILSTIFLVLIPYIEKKTHFS